MCVFVCVCVRERGREQVIVNKEERELERMATYKNGPKSKQERKKARRG